MPTTLHDGNKYPLADTGLNVSRGCFPEASHINKYGRATNVDSGVVTDVWDRANATDDQDIWVAPTAPRVHAIVSSDVTDDAAGTGARTVKIFGLPDWDTEEVSEIVTLDGTTPVNTANSYVIIHRMRATTWGTDATNNGVITATAATDATVTAQINMGEGQTQMAIWGVPSGQTAYMTSFYASVLRANLGTTESFVDLRLVANPTPNLDVNSFIIRHTIGVGSRGGNPFRQSYIPLKVFQGPAILKLQAIGSANNLDVSGGFDAIIITESMR